MDTDTARQLAAAAAVFLVAGGVALAVRCHLKGLIGRKRWVALGVAALLAASALGCALWAFAPSEEEEKTPAVEEEPQDGGASVTSDGRVVYKVADPAGGDLDEPAEVVSGNAADPGTALTEPQADAAGQEFQEVNETAAEAEPEGTAQENPADGNGQTGDTTAQVFSAERLPRDDGATSPGQQATGPQAAAPQLPALTERPAAAQPVRLDFIGGGSCTLVGLPDGTSVLVGAGSAESGVRTAERLASLGVRSVDRLVLPGPEDACAGGFGDIASRIGIGSVIVAADRDPEVWGNVLAAVAQTGVSLTEVDDPLELASAGGAAVHLSPASAGHLAVRVAGGGRSALLGCADLASALAASPGRTDVLDAGTLLPEGADPDALRELWPSLVVAGGTADGRWAEEAFGMASVVSAAEGVETISLRSA